MTFLEWRDEFKLGNEEIDQQHRELVDLLNTLHEEMKGRRLKEVMGPMLDRIIDHTRRHFADEEEGMHNEAFPGIDAHRNAHLALIHQVENLRARYQSGNMILSNEVLEVLKEWLVGHMIELDKEFGNFLTTKSGGKPPSRKKPTAREKRRSF